MKFNLYDKEIKFAQAVNKAIQHKVIFSIFRTVEGKVQKFDIRMIHVDFQTNPAYENMFVEYLLNSEVKVERVTKQDLMLISQQARQLEQKQAARR